MNINLRNVLPLVRTKKILRIDVQKFSSGMGEVVIPKKVPRGSTDILRALANTVQRDPTAAHYKYHDDPYLIPYSNLTKRSYGLSQEAGRKAAQWVRQQHSDFFQHKVSEPLIEAFVPKVEYTEQSEVSENDLLNTINNTFVSDAITVYKLMKQRGIDISTSTELQFLELLCYYNAEDPIPEDWIEERWYRQASRTRGQLIKTWKDGGLAEQLFKELKSTHPSAYSALISGMSTYGQIEMALSVYEEAKEKRIPLSVHAYNNLMARVNTVKESHNMMWDFVQSMMIEMSENKITPDIETLNAVLETLSFMSTNKNAKHYTLKIISEFKNLGISPSLASYFHIINIYARDRSKLGGVMHAILDKVENTNVDIVDPKDTMFFVRAMELCFRNISDKYLAYRLNDFLHCKENYNLVGDSYKESQYYRYLFLLLSETEPLDKFMEFYNSYVPHVYIPEPSVMMSILKSVDRNMTWELLPRLWSDIVMFEQSDRANLLEAVLQIAAASTDESLRGQMVRIAWSIWEVIEGQKKDRGGLIVWSGPMLGDLLTVCLEAEDTPKADLVLNKIERLQNGLIGEPSVNSMRLYIDTCIADANPDLAIKCIGICQNIGFIETEGFAKRLVKSLDLTDQQEQKLASIVGEDIIKSSTRKNTKENM